MSKTKNKSKKPAAELTGHDGKAERESADRREWERDSDRPNGCSGNWS